GPVRPARVRPPLVGAPRSVSDARPVGGPHRRRIVLCGVEGEPGGPVTRDLGDPDVAAAGVVTMRRNPAAVGRELDAAVTGRRTDGPLGVAIPRDPHHLRAL